MSLCQCSWTSQWAVAVLCWLWAHRSRKRNRTSPDVSMVKKINRRAQRQERMRLTQGDSDRQTERQSVEWAVYTNTVVNKYKYVHFSVLYSRSFTTWLQRTVFDDLHKSFTFMQIVYTDIDQTSADLDITSFRHFTGHERNEMFCPDNPKSTLSVNKTEM